MKNVILLQVTRCPTGDPPAAPHADCRDIVSAQAGASPTRFQVPEPWRGDIENAPLLFISSNPAFDPGDDCPTAAQLDPDVVAYYNAGFPRVFPRNVSRTGAVSRRPVNFWSHLRARAAECYGIDRAKVVAGVAFALTEVVHCKSNGEFGARTAATECVRRHFANVVSLSRACVVAVFGSLAAESLGLAAEPAVLEQDWYGKRRLLVWLPHPNAREDRTFAKLYTTAQMNTLREALRRC
jgi:hypothetical protein